MVLFFGNGIYLLLVVNVNLTAFGHSNKPGTTTNEPDVLGALVTCALQNDYM